ncbi:hypothetical protein [uncultured Alistipes sp.]|uniref:hypothetical protein n=1 Tax=uncultured Alistipes sp. TaxID=538949 RepID=UPI002618AA7E|nr:hypothetical protein [uncultured Alistipes sp.]
MATSKATVARSSNKDLWNVARALSPTFASHTAKATADFFTERTFASLNMNGYNTLNEFYGIIMPYYLNIVNISHAKDPLDKYDIGEYFTDQYGEVAQRIAVNSIKPIDPAYRNLENGPGPDPFVIRKPEISNRFFEPNFDYASLVTIPDMWMTARIFTSEYGFSELLAGIFAGLENGYINQKYLVKKEALNAALNDSELQASQNITVDVTADPTQATEAQLINFIMAIKSVISTMEATSQTSAYNALGFEDSQDIDRLRLIVRPGFKAAVDLIAARNSFNRDTLNLPIPVAEISDFGGLKPVKKGTKTAVYPVYDSLGTVIGFADTQDATKADYPINGVDYQDPNADTIGALMDKGTIFEIRHNPYEVTPIYNPRGRYTNHWASAPNNMIKFDRLYTFVKFTAAPVTPSPDPTPAG